MPQFSYKARRRSGEVVQGVLEVADRSAAVLQIERLGLLPVAIDSSKGAVKAAEKAERGFRATAASSNLMPPALREFFQKKRTPKLQELATFTQQLSNLLKSGMPLTVALNSMSHIGSNGISAD